LASLNHAVHGVVNVENKYNGDRFNGRQRLLLGKGVETPYEFFFEHLTTP
jgi:hypothetical protein